MDQQRAQGGRQQVRVACLRCMKTYDDTFRLTYCPHETFAANDGKNKFRHHKESKVEDVPVHRSYDDPGAPPEPEAGDQFSSAVSFLVEDTIRQIGKAEKVEDLERIRYAQRLAREIPPNRIVLLLLDLLIGIDKIAEDNNLGRSTFDDGLPAMQARSLLANARHRLGEHRDLTRAIGIIRAQEVR